MNDTNTLIKPLNDSNVMFIIGDSPTVTFNENVTVYYYPKEPKHIELKPAENKQINTIQKNSIFPRGVFKKIVNKISSFII